MYRNAADNHKLAGTDSSQVDREIQGIPRSGILEYDGGESETT
jgi:hypothetical protein